jgi:hypothetical protein
MSAHALPVTLVVLLAALTPLMTGAAQAATVVVDVSGGGDFEIIQEGIDAASAGDTVLVMPGTYVVSGTGISFGGKDLILRAAGGPSVTSIENNLMFASLFHIHEGETRAAVVEGFTVSGEWQYDVSPVLDIHDASPTIRGCRFVGNYADGWNHMEGWGGVGSFYRSSGALIDCWLEGNRAHCGVGGLGIIESSSVDIQGCTFISHRDEWEGIGALFIRDSNYVSISDCLFEDNKGSSSCFYIYNAYMVTVENCTFAGNGGWYYSDEPGGALIHYDSVFPMLISYCIFAFNKIDEILEEPANITSAWCCIYGNADGDTLTGNYDPSRIAWTDPLFCDMEAGDYTLCANSPCLTGSSGWADLVGAYGLGCGDCTSPIRRTSWGRIKAMYR